MKTLCPLCGAARSEATARCPSCGMHPGFGPEAPVRPFDAVTLWAMMGGIALVYAITLAVVALTR